MRSTDFTDQMVITDEIAVAFRCKLSWWDRLKVLLGFKVYSTFVVRLRIESIVDGVDVDMGVGSIPSENLIVLPEDRRH